MDSRIDLAYTICTRVLPKSHYILRMHMYRVSTWDMIIYIKSWMSDIKHGHIHHNFSMHVILYLETPARAFPAILAYYKVFSRHIDLLLVYSLHSIGIWFANSHISPVTLYLDTRGKIFPAHWHILGILAYCRRVGILLTYWHILQWCRTLRHEETSFQHIGIS